ncbi:hypothetical protein SUGI_1507090, partial [Cryptomeria japonica]
QSLVDSRRQHELNRDSGVESETNDIDIEEEIYRLLELNKWRLEAAAAPPAPPSPLTAQVNSPMAAIMPSSSDKSKVVPKRLSRPSASFIPIRRHQCRFQLILAGYQQCKYGSCPGEATSDSSNES